MDLFFVIALGAAAILGLVQGMGKVLKRLTRHLPGKIAAVVFTYFLFGTVLGLDFVQVILTEFVEMIAGWDNFFGKLLLIIRVDMIVFAVVLFFAVRLALKLAVSVLASFLEAKNPLSGIINRIGGALLSAACIFIVFLIVFQFAAWSTGFDGAMYEALADSRIGLDKLFLNNPLNAITETARLSLMGF